MELVEFIDVLGRRSVRPKNENALPIFEHITGGSISVTTESWESGHCRVAYMHGLSVTIEMIDEV